MQVKTNKKKVSWCQFFNTKSSTTIHSRNIIPIISIINGPLYFHVQNNKTSFTCALGHVRKLKPVQTNYHPKHGATYCINTSTTRMLEHLIKSCIAYFSCIGCGQATIQARFKKKCPPIFPSCLVIFCHETFETHPVLRMAIYE